MACENMGGMKVYDIVEVKENCTTERAQSSFTMTKLRSWCIWHISRSPEPLILVVSGSDALVHDRSVYW
jgi:hypothetical protein